MVSDLTLSFECGGGSNSLITNTFRRWAKCAATVRQKMTERNGECGCADRAWLVENRRTYLKHAVATAVVAGAAGCLDFGSDGTDATGENSNAGSSNGNDEDSTAADSRAGDDDARSFVVAGAGEFRLEVTGEIEPDPEIEADAEHGEHYGDDWVGFELPGDGETSWWYTGVVVGLTFTDDQTVEIDGVSVEDHDDQRLFYVRGEGGFSVEVTGEVEPHEELAEWVQEGEAYGSGWIENELSDNPETNYNEWYFTGFVSNLEYTPGQTVEIDGEVVAEGEDASGDDLDEMKLIDAHTHLVPEPVPYLNREPLYADDLVEWMDGAGVDEAVVLALDSPEAYPVMAPSPWIAEQCEQHPDRLIPFFTVDPRTGVYGRDALRDHFERHVGQGAKGFGEFKPGLEIGDPLNDPIYELCAEFDLPILFHSDDKAFMDDTDHSQLEEVLQSYPDVDFLGHGMGWWARISGDVGEHELGGYPTGPVDDEGAVPRLLSEYDNMYGELSGGSGWNALTRDHGFGQGFLEEHSDQIIYGTDYLFPGHDVPHLQLFSQFELDEDAWRDIRYRNIESVLRD